MCKNKYLNNIINAESLTNFNFPSDRGVMLLLYPPKKNSLLSFNYFI